MEPWRTMSVISGPVLEVRVTSLAVLSADPTWPPSRGEPAGERISWMSPINLVACNHAGMPLAHKNNHTTVRVEMTQQRFLAGAGGVLGIGATMVRTCVFLCHVAAALWLLGALAAMLHTSGMKFSPHRLSVAVNLCWTGSFGACALDRALSAQLRAPARLLCTGCRAVTCMHI